LVGKFDEYLVHQTEKPLAQVASDHSEWQDRFYFSIHDRNGELAAITGLGAFPNRKTVQAYMFAVLDGEHYAYLTVRPLAEDREVMQAGTLSYTILEPLKSWRLELADAANNISGTLEFHARCPLYTFSPIEWENDGRTVVRQMHYTQAGVYQGSLTIGERRFDNLIGMRDRSWGIRDMRRVPLWIWIAAQFRDYCVSAWRWETPEGEVIHQDGAITFESGQAVPISAIEHDLELTPGTKKPRRARFRLTAAGGEKRLLTAGEIGTIFLGPPWARWSEKEEGALARADAASFGYDQHCRFEMDNELGYGIVEYMVTGGSARYGIPPATLPGG
jgi:hypothetical protein